MSIASTIDRRTSAYNRLSLPEAAGTASPELATADSPTNAEPAGAPSLFDDDDDDDDDDVDAEPPGAPVRAASMPWHSASQPQLVSAAEVGFRPIRCHSDRPIAMVPAHLRSCSQSVLGLCG
jgi:hypothetical protein